jgi:hypothetical protein
MEDETDLFQTRDRVVSNKASLESGENIFATREYAGWRRRRKPSPISLGSSGRHSERI